MPRRHWTVAAVVAATTLSGLTSAAAAPPTPYRATTPAAAVAPTTTASTSAVTLITGDVVHLTTLPGGRHSVSVDAADPARHGQFQFTEQGGHVTVVPVDAIGYLADGQLDRNLFDVTTLVAQGYDDAHSKALPLLLSAGPGRAGARAALPATPPGAHRSAELPAIGAVAVSEVKSQAHTFWAAVSAGSTSRTRPALAGGVHRIWLDQRVHATVSGGAAQVGAPTAWAAGYDGHGVRVAVLDSGYDPHHPDLTGQVVAARNFTDEDAVTDRFGHGTHVASIIAGTGAAGHGQHRGVAPGADLLVGKVLDNTGHGLDSQIIAGMQWAVDNGARVVNMSMGGLPTDGTDPISQAVNELTARSGALFVISAGNFGPGGQQVTSPGAASAALTVGAVDSGDRMADFSSRGPRLGDSAIKPDLVAPGVDIVAARAAGTRLGDIINTDYISMSGTSMAAPNVAGTAAILAQQHPTWHAGQLKAALMATAHHLEEPSVAAQGVGRVDLAAASRQRVVPDTGALEFPRQSYTGTRRDPVTRTVSYRNDATTPVTVELATDVADTGAAPHHSPALSVTPRRLTIPAGSTASATVRLDPDATTPDSYAGYLTARMADGTVLRTTVGFTVDGPTYPVQVRALDRAGHPSAGFNTMQVWSLDTGEMRYGSLLDGSDTLDLPAGKYAIMAYLNTFDAGGWPRDVSFVGDPEFVVDGPGTLVLDARTANPIRLRTDEAARTEQFGLVWERTAGSHSVLTGQAMPGWTTPVYAAPTRPVHSGTFRFFSRWDLAAVPLTARVTGPHGFDLPAPEPVDLTPRLDGRYRLRLVDAGLGRAEDFARVDARGALVLVTRHSTDGNPDTPAQLDRAKKAGAVAVLVANDQPGLYLDGAWGATEPGYTVERDTGQRLRALLASDGTVSVELTAVGVSPFRYDLMYTEDDRIPADLDYDARRRNLARVDVDYHAQTDRMKAADGRMAYPPGVDVAFEMTRTLHPPQHRTEYLSTGETVWIHHTMADTWNWLGDAYGLAHTYRPGERDREMWFGAISRPALPATEPDLRHGAPVTRFADSLRVTIPQHANGSADQYSLSGPFSETTELTLSAADGRTLGSVNEAVTEFDVPGAPGRYQLTMRSARTEPWHQDWVATSVSTTTRWTFDSARPATGHYAVLPLMQVDYDLGTDGWNQVRAGHTSRLDLHVGYQPGYHRDHRSGHGHGSGMHAEVAVSFDDGHTWRAVAVHDRAHGRFSVRLPAAPAGAGFGSLRVTAWDGHGDRIEQTIDRAFRIAPPAHSG